MNRSRFSENILSLESSEIINQSLPRPISFASRQIDQSVADINNVQSGNTSEQLETNGEINNSASDSIEPVSSYDSLRTSSDEKESDETHDSSFASDDPMPTLRRSARRRQRLKRDLSYNDQQASTKKIKRNAKKRRMTSPED